MDLNHIQEYVVLAKELNFTAAATKLYIAQPTLTKHIVEMEKELGTKLFIRSKHEVSLTEIGQNVLPRFERLLADYEEITDDIARTTNTTEGLLKLGVLYYFVEEFINPILPIFNRKYPGIKVKRFSFQPMPAFQALENDQIDMAITFHYPYGNARRYECVDIAKEQCVLVTSGGHPLSSAKEASLEELHSETFVFLEALPYISFMNKLLQEKGIVPGKIIYCDQIDSLDYVLNECNGVSIMPEDVQNMVRSNIGIIPLSDQSMIVPICALYKKSNLNPAIPLYLDVVKKTFGNDYRGFL